MIKFEVQEDCDEDYICESMPIYGITKLKAVICDALFLKNAFPHHRFLFKCIKVAFSRSTWY